LAQVADDSVVAWWAAVERNGGEPAKDEEEWVREMAVLVPGVGELLLTSVGDVDGSGTRPI